jgi:acetyl esterase/lipase
MRTPGLATIMLFSFAMVVCGIVYSQPVRELRDVVYAAVGDKSLALDLYLPAGNTTLPLLVWVHGGAWRSGAKESVPRQLITEAYAVASLDFRQSTDAPFPANVHDIKAAIRFLRAKAATYGFDPNRFAIAGSSSGGHLATLAGVTNNHKELEGSVGDYLNYSSSVQVIVDYYGATNLMTILAQSTPHGLSVREPALRLLLSDLPEKVPARAALASPVNHIDAKDPPLLILHGDQDPQMPINQAHEIVGKYQAAGLQVTFDVVYGGAHGGDLFFTGEHLDRVMQFLKRHYLTQPEK